MSIKIEISESEATELKEYYISKLHEVDNELQNLYAKKAQFQNIISRLINKKTSQEADHTLPLFLPPSPDEIYPSKGTILERIEFILRTSNSPLNTREIIDRVFLYQPHLKTDKDLESRTAKNVSTILSIHKGKKFYRTSEKGANYFSLKP